MKVLFVSLLCVLMGIITNIEPCWGDNSSARAPKTSAAASTKKQKKASIPPLRESSPKEAKPWTLTTSIPLYVAGGGGILLTSFGLIGSLSQPEPEAQPNQKPLPNATFTPWGVLFFGGLSVMSSSVSAALWRGYPKQWMAVIGSVLAGSLAVSGALLVGLGQDTLMLSMGWGFLASLPVHIIFNIVGWFNVKHHQTIQKQKEQSEDANANLTQPQHFRVSIAPSFVPNGAGIQLVGQF